MENKSNKMQNLLSFGLILLGVIFRFIPHPPNFAPINAIALFSGYSLQNKFLAFAIPLSIMFVSDLVLGLHSTIWAVYLSFGIIVLLGFTLRKSFSFKKLTIFAFASSTIFYLVTNFAVWLTSGMYPLTKEGLIQCYIMGLPFYNYSPLEMFGFSLLGDITYTLVIFGAYKLALKRLTKVQLES